MIKQWILCGLVCVAACGAFAAEYHVSLKGNDANPGSTKKPLKTISAAAEIAQPGDTITVHAGTYRERVNPPRGGTSDDMRITYQAAPGERVEIKGSEVVTGWKRMENDTWKLELENSFFGDFNPFNDVLSGHWFHRSGKPTGKGEKKPKRDHHTAAVYLNGEWLNEAATLEEVLKTAGKQASWFAELAEAKTIVWAQFPGVDPNKELTEVNARQTIFFPEEPGCGYITVRGFIMRQAATPWAPPTARGQMGLIGPHWSKGWIIEDNVISHAATAGVQLGNKDFGEFAGNVVGMNAIVDEGVRSGEWTKEKVGGHIVRRNHIHDCGATGINGNMGCAFSVIEGNVIHDIHMDRNWSGMEQGGIKLHGAIDVVIRGNVVYRTEGKARAIWLDWLGQGAVIEGNICFENALVDLFMEVTHGPALVANNVFLSPNSIVSTARGSAYVNNYLAGPFRVARTTRETPYAEPHSTKFIARVKCDPLDDRFLNNIFACEGPVLKNFWKVDAAEMPGLPIDMENNLYLGGAEPSSHEKNPVVLKNAGQPFVLKRSADGIVLEWNLDKAWLKGAARTVVTAERLGLTHIGKHPFEYPDGTPVVIDRDLQGKTRSAANSMPGPIEKPGQGSMQINYGRR